MDLCVHVCIVTSPYFPIATSPAIQVCLRLGYFGFSSIMIRLFKNRSGKLNFSFPECSIPLSLCPMLALYHVWERSCSNSPVFLSLQGKTICLWPGPAPQHHPGTCVWCLRQTDRQRYNYVWLWISYDHSFFIYNLDKVNACFPLCNLLKKVDLRRCIFVFQMSWEATTAPSLPMGKPPRGKPTQWRFMFILFMLT